MEGGRLLQAVGMEYKGQEPHTGRRPSKREIRVRIGLFERTRSPEAADDCCLS
ncbi:hypothetical protein PRIPAC_89681, partial [Pristionchus pacificus]|uniref:Uncharacterized protein n=1 Tax=Pristionchus pacificus TaxID=54126 RepID=A0A2A6B825_PRIPA